MNNLTKKTFKAGSWLFGHTALARISGIIRVGILARILTPAQFGIYGIATLILHFLETFSETSIDQALIQKKHLTEEDLSTAWFISTIRGIIISSILYLSAPLVAKFFHSSEATIYIQVLSISPLIRNIANPRINYYRRKLKFSKEFWQKTITTLVELILSIYLAFTLRSPWALVLPIVISSFIEVVVSFVIMKPPKSFIPNMNIAKSLMSFSKWLWGSSIVSYLVLEGDDVVVGRVLGPLSLALYQNAYKIASLPATQITNIASQAVYPALSTIKEDKKRLRNASKKMIGSIAAIGTLVAILIYIFAKPITLLFLGDQWLDLVPALKVLGIYSVLAAISTAFGPLFKAVGQPKIIMIFGMIRLSVLAIIIYPLTNMYGIVGSAWATVIAVIIPQPYLFWKVKKILS